jgi:predicted MFS family arabinose efflux permease
MDMKTKRFLVLFILIMSILGIFSQVGSYAADIMSSQTVVKNAMLCEILIGFGFLMGTGVLMISREMDRRYPSCEPGPASEKEP